MYEHIFVRAVRAVEMEGELHLDWNDENFYGVDLHFHTFHILDQNFHSRMYMYRKSSFFHSHVDDIQ